MGKLVWPYTRTGSEEGEDVDQIETPSSPIAIPSTPPFSPLDDIEESSPQPGSKCPASQLQGTPQKRNKPSLPSPEHTPNTQPPQITHDNILDVIYCILYVIYRISYVIYHILYVIYCILYAISCILYVIDGILYVIYHILYVIYCISYVIYHIFGIFFSDLGLFLAFFFRTWDAEDRIFLRWGYLLSPSHYHLHPPHYYHHYHHPHHHYQHFLLHCHHHHPH